MPSRPIDSGCQQYNTACESDDVADLLAGPGVENERLANWLVATL
jgi:hypothetical protein